MLGSLILYLKGMRIMMFQLSGFYCRVPVSLDGIYGVGTSDRGNALTGGAMKSRDPEY